MKKCCYLWLCLLCVVVTLQAQEIQPGVQAQGYLENKNVSVDYATGILNYRVPLFSLQTPTLTLPISLVYTANGIKVEQQTGIVGKGWTLDAGGIVTRIVRGVPDEYLYGGPDLDPASLSFDRISNIHYGAIDGESDIFTVILNGMKINFLWQYVDEKNQVIPLEATNVKIECLSNDGQDFSGWKVTDENGWLYLFRAQEFCNSYQKEGDTYEQNVYHPSYISSWYLSQLVVPGQDTIFFKYMGGAEFTRPSGR